MDKRKSFLILCVAIIALVVSVLCYIPVDEWSAMPYFLIPLGAGALIAAIGLVYRLVKNIPMRDGTSDEQPEISPELDDLEKIEGKDDPSDQQ